MSKTMEFKVLCDVTPPQGELRVPPRECSGPRQHQFSDEDTEEEIRMNPYLQRFIELSEFTHEAPFSFVRVFQALAMDRFEG